MGMIHPASPQPVVCLHQGEVRELREKERDVVIGPPRTAPAARLKIRDDRQFKALQAAQRLRLPVRVVSNAGLIQVLQVPTVPSRPK